MTSPSRETRTAAILDWVRGIAALMVVLGHARALFFKPFAESASKGIVSKALTFLFGFGHEAVVVFFVLSGFFVGGSVLRSMESGRWSWKRYFATRGSRLYIVVIPAMIIGGALDFYGINSTHAAVYAGGTGFSNVVPVAVANNLTPTAFLGNLAYLQTGYPLAFVDSARVPVFGSNGPAWSLAYEAWYYVAFPLLLLWRKGWSIVAAIAIAVLMGPVVTMYFLLWLMGAAVARMAESPIGRSKLFLSVAAIGALASLSATRQHLVHVEILGSGIVGDVVSGLFCATTLYAILHLPNPKVRAFGRFGEHAAGMSYTMYLFHMPLLVFLCAKVIGNGELWDLSASTLPKMIVMVAVVIVYAGLMWWLFERNTEGLRRALVGAGKELPASTQPS